MPATPTLDAFESTLKTHAGALYAAIEFDPERKRFVAVFRSEDDDEQASGHGKTVEDAIEGAIEHLRAVTAATDPG